MIDIMFLLKRIFPVQNKNVLIAGGTGLVGTHLTKAFENIGAHVLSTFHTSEPWILRHLYKKFDFTKFEECLEATRNRDWVCVCAGVTSGIQQRKKYPTAFVLPNLQIYAGLLEACGRNKVEKVVFISSATVYQEIYTPTREDHLDANQDPPDVFLGIGWINRYVEKLSKLYCKEYGLQIGIVRASNIYGPYDDFDDDKSHVVPALIKRAINKETPYIVWGNGHTIRDFLYVEDFIDDILDILKSYCVCDPVNVGSGRGITIREAVKVILDICHHNVSPQYDETKPTSIHYRVLDIMKLNSVIGPRKRTSFAEGINKTVEWYGSTVS